MGIFIQHEPIKLNHIAEKNHGVRTQTIVFNTNWLKKLNLEYLVFIQRSDWFSLSKSDTSYCSHTVMGR